MAVTVATML